MSSRRELRFGRHGSVSVVTHRRGERLIHWTALFQCLCGTAGLIPPFPGSNPGAPASKSFVFPRLTVAAKLRANTWHLLRAAPLLFLTGTADLLIRMSTGVLAKRSSETVRNHRNAVRDASEWLSAMGRNLQ